LEQRDQENSRLQQRDVRREKELNDVTKDLLELKKFKIDYDTKVLITDNIHDLERYRDAWIELFGPIKTNKKQKS
jgi:uncharacterized protein (DUF342 family)